MNKAPSLCQEPSSRKQSRPSIKKSSNSNWLIKDLEDTHPKILDTNSRKKVSDDPHQHRMVIAIDYGTTFSGKYQ